MLSVSCPKKMSTFSSFIKHYRYDINSHDQTNTYIHACRSYLQQITSVVSLLTVTSAKITLPLPLIQRINITDYVKERLHEHVWASNLPIHTSSYIRQRVHAYEDSIEVSTNVHKYVYSYIYLYSYSYSFSYSYS